MGPRFETCSYLDDAVVAFLLAAHTPACMGKVFNIGGAEPTTMLHVAELLVAANGGTGRFVTELFFQRNEQR